MLNVPPQFYKHTVVSKTPNKLVEIMNVLLLNFFIVGRCVRRWRTTLKYTTLGRKPPKSGR
jgi:hypothetical protein